MSLPDPALSDSVILRAENLGRSVPGKILVAGASFEVRKGETLAIVGPSGSGKSSLLRLLNRLDEPTSGTVYLDGTDYRQIPPRELRRRVGMVLQRPFLFPGKVADNLQFGPTQRGQTLSPTQIAELLAGVGLSGFEGFYPSQLSGGQQQRVAVARALVGDPLILMADEPTGNLDSKNGEAVMELLRDLHRNGATVCMVTHDQRYANFAERTIHLFDGRIVEETQEARVGA